jgi:hypothetical protein
LNFVAVTPRHVPFTDSELDASNDFRLFSSYPKYGASKRAFLAFFAAKSNFVTATPPCAPANIAVVVKLADRPPIPYNAVLFIQPRGQVVDLSRLVRSVLRPWSHYEEQGI